MAKKSKDDTPTANSVANRDIIQRLNFLYQASVYLNTVPLSPPELPNASPSSNTSTNATSDTPKSQKKGKRKKKVTNTPKRPVSAGDLARTYIATMKTVGQKTTVKIDPAVKRTLCKGCNMTLIPGATASVRVKKSPAHGHTMVYTCNSCRTSRRIPAPPTLSVGATADSSQPQPASIAGSEPAPPPGTVTSSIGGSTTSVGEAPMDVEPASGTEAARGAGKGRGKRKRVQPRLPPLFARDVGHVVFCGNERLVDGEHGDGVYIT